jgi:hypothetical protein
MKTHLLLFLALLALPLPALAQVEARAVALANNCKPTKIEVVSQTTGPQGQTIYLASCENKAPAAQGGAAATTASTLRISCRDKLCVTLN